MSRVRVLVGTRKGAFVLTSDGTRDRWDVSGPHFGGWEIYHLKGSPADPNRLYASQSSGWFGQVIQRSNDGGKTWESAGNKFAYDGPHRHAPVVRRHPASVGVRAGLASRALAERSGHRLRGGRGRRPVPHHRRRPELAGAAGAAHPRLGVPVAAGRGRDVPAHDPAGSEPGRADVRRHLGGGRVPQRRRGRDVAADEPRPQVGGHPRSHRRGRPLRAPPRDAPVAARRAVHAEALGRDAERRRGGVVARGEREPAERLRLPDRRARARAGDDLRRPDQERLGALSARRQAARVPQPDAAATSGSRSPRACPRATATSTCCATR